MRLVGHHDKSLDIRDLVGNGLEERNKHDVCEYPPVLGVIDDEYKLFGKQSWIDRMAYMTSATDPVIGFEVAVVVPGERRNAVAALRAESV